MAARRSFREPFGLLERTNKGSGDSSRFANGQATSGSANVQWRTRIPGAPHGAGPCVDQAEPVGGSDVVHDAPGSSANFAVALFGSKTVSHRHTDRCSQVTGAGRTNRILREYPRAANRDLRR